ncbi:hypothetical protein CNYM01_00748 [Colletotrichum nymphaeae SA-01]|uniref:Uncharacterized protein n=1 Tax=Colletotrichum nymphaeae SA-01 TaxID=1460502 RepID=A0A135TFK5_9PEZI|nr:hypothetical protein CNYM01_00748 [Colletotrichum nymphaeae SA-01]
MLHQKGADEGDAYHDVSVRLPQVDIADVYDGRGIELLAIEEAPGVDELASRHFDKVCLRQLDSDSDSDSGSDRRRGKVGIILDDGDEGISDATIVSCRHLEGQRTQPGARAHKVVASRPTSPSM